MKPRFSSLRRFVMVLGAASCGAVALTSCSGTDFTSGASTAGTGGGNEVGAGESGEANGGSAGEPSMTTPSDAGSSGDQGDAGSDPASGGSPTGGTGGTTNGGGAAGSTSGGAHGGSVGTGGAASTVKAFDDFVASAEGWTVTGDDTTKVPVYSSTGGHPNGQISAADATAGVLFFTAPKKYLGDVSAFYGGELRFDLKVTTTTKFFAYADVELTSNLLTLAYDCTVNPGATWTTYVVPLTEKGWKVTTITGAAATATQFQQVLANLTRLRIRGEFNDGADTGYLDNVYLGSKAGLSPAQ